VTEAWPGLSGRFRNGAHVLPVRVYYEDTDAGGVVYHARYLAFCERGRSDCLRLLGISQSELGDLAFVVRRLACDFLKPARLDDLLEIETRFGDLAGARLELDQQALLGGMPVFRARVTIALIDRQGRPKRLPQEMTARFQASMESGFVTKL
jgi:acyl-CoA thioester hydrolase